MPSSVSGSVGTSVSPLTQKFPSQSKEAQDDEATNSEMYGPRIELAPSQPGSVQFDRKPTTPSQQYHPVHESEELDDDDEELDELELLEELDEDDDELELDEEDDEDDDEEHSSAANEDELNGPVPPVQETSQQFGTY